MSLGSRFARAVVRWYQLVLRPLLPAACRFQPSCSEYARAVLSGHGAIHGSWLALRRLARCHPFHVGGYDPPPETLTRPREGRRS